jgi:hypothetical protein
MECKESDQNNTEKSQASSGGHDTDGCYCLCLIVSLKICDYTSRMDVCFHIQLFKHKLSSPMMIKSIFRMFELLKLMSNFRSLLCHSYVKNDVTLKFTI